MALLVVKKFNFRNRRLCGYERVNMIVGPKDFPELVPAQQAWCIHNEKFRLQ